MTTLWIAHVRLREGQPDEQVPCDAAHVNDQGYLTLTVNTYVGAIACYAPGVWDGYTLEAASQPVTEEQMMRGEKSLNDYRRSLDEPKVGDRLHVWGRLYGCLAGTVERPMAFSPGFLIKADDEDLPLNPLAAAPHDESRTVNASWHWPCDTEPDPDSAAEPDAPAPTTLTINVAGSVLAERNLRRIVDEQIVQHIKNTSGYYSRAFRR